MKTIYKLGISLGATTSIVAPLTTVIACSSSAKTVTSFDTDKTVTKIMMQDLQKIDAIAPYSAASLQAEAKKIGGEVIWRGSLQQEAIAQGMNLLYQLAEKLGYNQSQELNSLGIKVITDEMANKSDDALLTDLGFAAGTDEAKTALHLKNIKLNSSQPTTEDMRKYTFKMSPGNQTIDGDGDFKQMNMTSPEQSEYGMYTEDEFQNDPSKTPHSVNSLRGKYLMNTWIKGKDINIIFGEKEGVVVRKIVNPNAAQSYPSIKDEADFAENYAPFVSGLIQKFIGSLGDMVDSASMFVGSPLGSIISFLMNEFATETTDATGITTKTIDFADDKTKNRFAHAISEVNKTGNVNWLAVKAFYLGFDESFTENGYENWTVNKDWAAGSAFTGVKEFSSFVDLIGITSWQHGASKVVFNPSLSADENIALNDKYSSFN